MSTLTNMQLLVTVARPLLDSAMKRLEMVLPKSGPCHYSLYPNERELRVVVFAGSTRPITLGQFSLSYLPGCREVVVLHGVSVDPTVRHQGVGSLPHSTRLDIARGVGAKVALCTVLSGNSAERAIIQRAGWRVALQVNQQVEMWAREL